MEIRFQGSGPAAWRADALLAPILEGRDGASWLQAAAPWLAGSLPLAEFRAEAGASALVYAPAHAPIPRVLLLGLGAAGDFSVEILRKAMGVAMRDLGRARVAGCMLPRAALAPLPGGAMRLIEEAVYGACLGLYEFTALKKPEAGAFSPEWLALGFDEAVPPEAEKAAARGRSAARAVCLARDLDNMPANILYPDALATRAEELASAHGFSCKVLNDEELSRLGMGALLAVGRGSAHPPRLALLEHGGERPDSAPLLLAGKGLTFDSGGISLKPAANMGQMKCDMSGAGACLAAMCAIAEEKLPQRVVAVLACAENMPDGRAQRPGDVVRAYSGDTIEIVNTDAEGRLVLCDALAYACREYRPAALIDVATLTGACAVALGSGLGGLFCTDEDLCSRLLALGQAAGESLWRLPFWEPYRELLKSDVADIAHTGPREGGAITAALFLRHFVDRTVPYAHLDIAGVDWNAKKTPLCPVGATGFGTRTLLELARGGLAA